MIIPKHTTSNTLIIFLALLCLFLPSILFAAATYEPLVGIPGLDKTATLPEYINVVYAIVVGLGAVYGVFKIAYIGFKYSLSDSIIGKVDAKSEIGGVLLGLFLLLIPFIVLKTINPELVKVDLLRNLGKVSALNITPSTQPIVTQEQINERAATIISDTGSAPWGTQIVMCRSNVTECRRKCTENEGGTFELTSGTDGKCIVPPIITSCDGDTREECADDCNSGRIEQTSGATGLSCIQPKYRSGSFFNTSGETLSQVIPCSYEKSTINYSGLCIAECNNLKGNVKIASEDQRYICEIPSPRPMTSPQ